ncbi:MAG: hypothetical protein ABI806_06545 [Candidatus Solibacter sp.]
MVTIMKLHLRISIRLLLVAASLSSVGLAQSRYAAPFENYRRSHDSEKLGNELRDVSGIKFSEDIPYLIGVISNDNEETLVRWARLKLLTITSGLVGVDIAAIQDRFLPAIPVFENHLASASTDDEKFQWAMSIASLTAFVGLQPTPDGLSLFYRMVESGHEGNRRIALLALARVKPLPAKAKGLILHHYPGEFPSARLGRFAFALEDADIQKEFVSFLDSDEVQDQQLAAKTLADVGPRARPALAALIRLQNRPGLDETVARNVKKAIDAIDRNRSELNR